MKKILSLCICVTVVLSSASFFIKGRDVTHSQYVSSNFLIEGPVHNINTNEFFKEIQTGIDDPDTKDGDTIEVAAGTYFEHLVIGKGITLIGEDRNTTIIDASGKGDVVLITVDGVCIRNFNLVNGGNSEGPAVDAGIEIYYAKNCCIENNNCSNARRGIFLNYSEFNTITNNIISNSYVIGIHIFHSGDNLVENNIFTANDYGIAVAYEWYNKIVNNVFYSNNISIYTYGANNNEILNNTCINSLNNGIYVQNGMRHIISYNNIYSNGSSGRGIYLDNIAGVPIDNTISHNTISLLNGDGIYLMESMTNQIYNNCLVNNKNGIHINFDSDNNTIFGNEIYNSSSCGIMIYWSDYNTVFRNNMINNLCQATQGGDQSNYWNVDYPSGGNYWSDYMGIDIYHGLIQSIPGSDGIGDTPYLIEAVSQDNYPLMSPFDSTDYEVPLQEGWNLISLPLRQPNESIDSVLENIVGKYDCIQAYNSSNPSKPWESYATFKPASLNNLNSMNHLRSYWVHMTEPGLTLTVQGDKFGSALSIPLKAGWNLVGYPTLNTTTTVANALWGTGADHVEVCDQTDPYRTKEVGPTDIMKPGEGYWVHVVVDCVWVINW